MFESKSVVKRKASVSIEFVLSALLGIVVLFMVLGLFSNNLEAMTSNSGMKGLFHNSTEQANFAPSRTTYEVSTDNHTVTKAQIEVSIVGDQGLEWFKKQALVTIQRLGPQTTLTAGQMADLKSALTVYAVANSTTSSLNESYCHDCYVARTNHNIGVEFDRYRSGRTYELVPKFDVAGNVVTDNNRNPVMLEKNPTTWNDLNLSSTNPTVPYPDAVSAPDASPAEKIKNIIAIKKLF